MANTLHMSAGETTVEVIVLSRLANSVESSLREGKLVTLSVDDFPEYYTPFAILHHRSVILRFYA